MPIVQDIKKERWVLTDEGKKYAEAGSPEVQLFLAIPAEEGIAREDLQVVKHYLITYFGCFLHWSCATVLDIIRILQSFYVFFPCMSFFLSFFYTDFTIKFLQNPIFSVT